MSEVESQYDGHFTTFDTMCFFSVWWSKMDFDMLPMILRMMFEIGHCLIFHHHHESYRGHQISACHSYRVHQSLILAFHFELPIL